MIKDISQGYKQIKLELFKKIGKNDGYEKTRATIAEMLLKAIPKDLAPEAVTKRLDNPLEICC